MRNCPKGFYFTSKERFDYLKNSTYKEHSKSFDHPKSTAQIRPCGNKRHQVFDSVFLFFQNIGEFASASLESATLLHLLDIGIVAFSLEAEALLPGVQFSHSFSFVCGACFLRTLENWLFSKPIATKDRKMN